MSVHPNAMLICRLTPDGTSRKTMREIRTAFGAGDDTEDVKIDGKDYHSFVMEDTYDESWQVAGKEGDLVFFQFLTYGYGESVTWDEVVKRQQVLETWAKEQSAAHSCRYAIEISANHW